ncbi:MAG: DNA topoisomerase 4 subunit A, partial [Clostridia bacterium]|nr:DNA topoisomerase 4 subunit A [Clostridia bacterium]
YSECVILDRALPRVEDGLKPVQRRILFDMIELGLHPDRAYKKCARVVGDCMGKYHAHGDSSVYNALVRMAQPFNMSATLVEGQGNFGDIDGNGAAAMRYTECKLTPLSMEMLRDMGDPDDEIVPWTYNFDDTLKEPEVLPGRFPNLLVNGASGIAVGLATNIPTHNLCEAIDGCVAYINDKNIKLDEMMKFIKGPDFPSGGYIIAGDELKTAYETGKGKIIIKAKTHIEADGDKKLIVIDELPYQVNKSALLESISKLRDEKKGVLANISDITDESDRNGIRAVIKVKKDGDVDAIMRMLFKSTNMSVSFGINMVAIAEGKPKTLSLLEIIKYYVDYQREFVVRRTKFELDACKKREHILEGLIVAVRNIDEVVKVIKNSQSTTEAKANLRARFNLSERQAEAILDLRLARLTHLEVYKLEKELEEIREKIVRLTAILASKKEQMKVVKEEMLAIKKAYKTPRRSVILDKEEKYEVVDESIPQPLEPCIVCVNERGNLKRMTVKRYNMSSRAFGDKSSVNDIHSCIASCAEATTLWCFTDQGQCHRISPADIPECRWGDKGTPLRSIAPDALSTEKIVYLMPVGETPPQGHSLFFTNFGNARKTPWSEFEVNKNTYQAIILKPGEKVIGIEHEMPGQRLFFVTKKGLVVNLDGVSGTPVGRKSQGSKHIELNEGDEVVFIGQGESDGDLLFVSNKGYAKRVGIKENFKENKRYNKGNMAFPLGEKSGDRIVFAGYVHANYGIVLKVSDDYLSHFNTNALARLERTSQGKPLVRGKVDISVVYVYNDDINNGI